MAKQTKQSSGSKQYFEKTFIISSKIKYLFLFIYIIYMLWAFGPRIAGFGLSLYRLNNPNRIGEEVQVTGMSVKLLSAKNLGSTIATGDIGDAITSSGNFIFVKIEEIIPHSSTWTDIDVYRLYDSQGRIFDYSDYDSRDALENSLGDKFELVSERHYKRYFIFEVPKDSTGLKLRANGQNDYQLNELYFAYIDLGL